MKRGLLLTEICSEGESSILWDYDTIPTDIRTIYDPLLGLEDSTLFMNIYEFGNQKIMNSKSSIRIKSGESIEYLGEITVCHPNE